MKFLENSLIFIKNNLWHIHTGDFDQRILSSSKLGLAVSPIAYILSVLTDWFSLNSGYVIFVFIAIIIDHLIGSYVHAFVKRDFELKKNIKGFFTKTVLAITVGIIAEGIVHILGTGLFITDYFTVLSQITVFLYPAGSALMNISILTNGRFPPTAWIEKIKKFNQDADLRHFKGDDDDKL